MIYCSRWEVIICSLNLALPYVSSIDYFLQTFSNFSFYFLQISRYLFSALHNSTINTPSDHLSNTSTHYAEVQLWHHGLFRKIRWIKQSCLILISWDLAQVITRKLCSWKPNKCIFRFFPIFQIIYQKKKLVLKKSQCAYLKWIWYNNFNLNITKIMSLIINLLCIFSPPSSWFSLETWVLLSSVNSENIREM